MFTQLNQDVIDLLCCPFCKGSLTQKENSFKCEACATTYPPITTTVGNHDEVIHDFRIHQPPYSQPAAVKPWLQTQEAFEDSLKRKPGDTPLETFINEIDSLKEIYVNEFHLSGHVLDVGGYDGRLRHYISQEDTPLYVSVDPCLDAFSIIPREPNLLKAYPCLLEPCNFLACHAERLPFKNGAFDYVHMRSVVDHFADPFLAFKEAYRVLRPAGHIMVGLAIIEKITREHSKKKRHLLRRAVKKLKRRGEYSFRTDSKIFGGTHDDHIFRFTHQELLDLLSVTGFQVEKQHWISFCIYLAAKKKNAIMM